MKYTLITGASMGIGKEIAKYCASLNRNLLLISLPNENLNVLAKEIAFEYGVKVAYKECDLTLEDTPQLLHDWVISNNYQLNFLINNAGFGGVEIFKDTPASLNNGMIDLNIKATVNLCHIFISELEKNSPSFILNTSSMAANFPFPYKTVYASSKVFIKNFTIALAKEVKDLDIHVSVVQYGATPTNKVVKDQIELGGTFSKISLYASDYTAKTAIDKTLNKKTVIIPGIKNKIFLRIMKLIPSSMLQNMLANKTKQMFDKINTK